jgi:DNA-binding MarR family transcriptional regulator
MTNTLSKSAEQAWARLVRVHHKAMSSVETALKQANLPPLGWYDALLELERAGDCGLRPFELEERLLLPQYGLSRLLARLEAAGCMRRWRCEEDGRGQVVSITDEGRRVRQLMWPVYAGALQAVIGDKLTPKEAEDLERLLGLLLEQAS